MPNSPQVLDDLGWPYAATQVREDHWVAGEAELRLVLHFIAQASWSCVWLRLCLLPILRLERVRF